VTQSFNSVSSTVVVSNLVSNLNPAQLYHYRMSMDTTSGTVSGADHTFFTPGPPSGSALRFNGTNSYVNVGGIAPVSTNLLTLEAWIQPSVTSNSMDIVRQGTSSTPDWLLSLQYRGSSITFGLKVAGAYKELRAFVDPTFLTDGSWHHVAATYDGSNKTIYLDGSIAASSTNQTGSISFTSAALSVGASLSGPSEYFKGLIDEVRVWSTARSAAEIRQNMEAEIGGAQPGLAAYYRFSEGSGSTTSDISGNGRNGTLINNPAWVSSTAPVIPLPVAITGQASNISTNSATLNGSIFTVGNSFTAYFDYGLTTNYGSQTSPQSIADAPGSQNLSNTVTGLSAGTQYHFRLVATNNSGVIMGQDKILTTSGAIAGNALLFNGTNSYVRMPVLDLSAGSNITIEAWIKPADLSSNPVYTIVRQQAFSTTDFRLAFANNGGSLVFGLRTGSTYQELTVPIQASYFLDNAWHQITATYDGLTQRVFVDGVAVGSLARSAKIAFTATNNSLGAEHNGVSPSNFFSGQIDEVRIWSIARTASDIAANYNRSLTGFEQGLAIYYRFDESAGTSANDSSGNGRTGVLVNNPIWVGSTAPILPLQVSISGFSPFYGRPGNSVTIIGTNFLSATGVLFNGVPATFSTNANGSLNALVPTTATTGPISVTNAWSSSTSTNAFIVDVFGPAVTFLGLTNSTFVTGVPVISASVSDPQPSSGVASVNFFLARESDGLFWTGLGWGGPTALSGTNSGNVWSRNFGLPGGTNLNDGAYTIYVVANDNAGNSTTVDVGVTVNKNSTVAPIKRLSNGQVQLNFPGIPARTYRVQASTNLTSWVDIGTVTVDSSGILQFQDAGAAALPYRFYRTAQP
jgi:hypothetical protein